MWGKTTGQAVLLFCHCLKWRIRTGKLLNRLLSGGEHLLNRKLSLRMNSSKVMIIGGGPAGITLTRALRTMVPEMEVTMFRPEPHSMIYCAIPYAIEGIIEPATVYKEDSLVSGTGANLIRRKVTGVDFGAKTVVDDSGRSHRYDKLVIATGAVPLLPAIPGTEASNVFTVKTQEDMENILARMKKTPRRAIVVGAGAIGMEQAQAYRARGIETWLIDFAPRVLPHMLDEDISAPMADVIRGLGIHLRLDTSVQKLECQNGGNAVMGAALSNGEEISLNPETDFVCFAVGMQPDFKFLADTEIEYRDDGIIVDAQMRTSIPDVFAVGDVCSYVSLIDGRPLGGKLATNAVPMAKVAARVIAGKEDSYEGFVNGAATCVGDWRVGGSGFTATYAAARGFDVITGHAEVFHSFPIMPGSQPVRAKIIAERKSRRIIGGQFAAKTHVTDKVDVVSLAIQKRMTLNDLASLSYSSQPWQSFYPAGSAIVNACENALASQ